MSMITKEELHFRRIDMRGYRRSDGLFEVEGRVVDRKTYDFGPLADGARAVPAHEPIHDMGVRLVFDALLSVRAVETFTEAAPHSVCAAGGNALQCLVGLQMTSGWTREVRSRLAGARSCTHLMELLSPMATVAFQTTSIVRKGGPEALDATGRPKKIDSCYAYGAEREVVQRRWPEHYRPPGD